MFGESAYQWHDPGTLIFSNSADEKQFLKDLEVEVSRKGRALGMSEIREFKAQWNREVRR